MLLVRRSHLVNRIVRVLSRVLRQLLQHVLEVLLHGHGTRLIVQLHDACVGTGVHNENSGNWVAMSTHTRRVIGLSKRPCHAILSRGQPTVAPWLHSAVWRRFRKSSTQGTASLLLLGGAPVASGALPSPLFRLRLGTIADAAAADMWKA